jgi:hypothetical protein
VASIGDVFVSLRLDTTQFERGVATATQQAGRLGQVLDQFGRPMDRVVASVTDAGAATQVASGHFDLGGRSMARFAAIGVQQLIPSLEGSRVALEGAFQGVSKLTGGYGALVLTGAAAAAAVGGAVFLSLRNTEQGTRDAFKGINSLDDSMGKLEKQIEDNMAALERWRGVASTLGNVPGELSVLPGETGTSMAGAQIDRIWARIKGLRETIEVLKGAKLMEDPAVGPKGSIATGLESQRATALEQLDKDLNKFLATSRIALTEDPLGKMLAQDWQRTQDAIDKVRELTFLTEDEKNKRIGALAAQGGANQIEIRGQQTKVGEKDLAARMGLGPANLLSGFGQLTQITKDIDQFTGSIAGMAREGVSARDLFPQIAEGQAKFNEQIAAAKEQYKDQPAILERLISLEKQYGGVGLQRTLDDKVRGLQNVKQGTADILDENGKLLQSIDGSRSSISLFIDTAEGINAKLNPALRNTGIAVAGIATAVDDALIPAASDSITAFDAVEVRVITLTDRWYDLARAIHAASVEMLFNTGIAGVGQTSRVAAPPQ